MQNYDTPYDGFLNCCKQRLLSMLISPIFWLVLILIILAILLSLSLSVPIGPMYWDSYIYLDASQRIATGQVPNVDFSTPAGPLGYYLFYYGLELFPHAQLLLLVQWSILIVAAPLMAMALPKDNRLYAFLLLIPFLCFAVMPANVQAFHTYPALDGFGIYNRHTSLLLYVLMSGLLFIRDSRKLAVFCALTMAALFLTKITGFLTGGLFGMAALLAGRISLIRVVQAAIIFLVMMGLLEAYNHQISAYLFDIQQLLTMNEAVLLPRFLTVFSVRLDVILPASLLVLSLLWIERARIVKKPVYLMDSHAFWLGVALVGGIILETQNTGSQEFIFIWPVLVMIFARFRVGQQNLKILCFVLAAFSMVPLFSQVSHKTLRALAVAPGYQAIPIENLKNMDQVLARNDFIERAELLEEHYSANPQGYLDLAQKKQLPNWTLFSAIDYQLYWLLSASQLVKDLQQFEKDQGVRFETIMNLDFVNPFAWILDRKATPYLQIGADIYRTVPPLNDKTNAAIEATDVVLRSKCPVTMVRDALYEHFAPALKQHKIIELNPCWDILIRNDVKLKEQ